MAKDYYTILGLEKGASKDDIKKAFYKLAQKYHPDKEGGDERKFKEVNEAYQVLSNDQKRAQYDQFGTTGGPGAGGGFGGFDFGGQGGSFHFGGQEINLEDLFGQFGFGGARMRRGRDLQTQVTIAFKESLHGAKRMVSVQGVPNVKTPNVEVSIPAGIRDGERLVMQGYGEQVEEGAPGDLYIIVRVSPEKGFFREGPHVVTDINVSLSEALLGGKHRLSTVDGTIDVTIPGGLQPGQILRVRGKGAQTSPKGDLLIRTHIQVPKKLNKKQRKLIEELKKEGL